MAYAEAAAVDYNDGPEPGSQGAVDTDELLRTLVNDYETSEQSSSQARIKAERDRDYIDNKQWTDEEARKLEARGQPVVAFNVLRSRARFFGGLEKNHRRDPKAWPRNNPEDAQAAEAFTEGMRYAVSTAKYPAARSQAWNNIAIEGFGGVEWGARQNARGEWIFEAKRLPWSRLYYDPHSAEPNFSDARYLGQVLWMDYDEAMARYRAMGFADEAIKAVLDTTLASVGTTDRGQTYDDRPRWNVWADCKRKRVRVCLEWRKEADGWHYHEFTGGGLLMSMPGAYLDEDGETYCPWVMQSMNVDRDNNRYGEIRHLIDPQDEINKRRSKAMHLVNTRGVIAEEGAVDDVNKARRELAKPDFWLTKNPNTSLEIQNGAELAAGQAQLLAQAMAYVQESAPGPALMGHASQDQSGRAIEAQQQGGLIEYEDAVDILAEMDERSFRVVAWMMKQFWTAETWIRVTDDEMAPRWIGLNVPATAQQPHPMIPGQMIQAPVIDPATGQQAVQNNVAELDLDIIISDAPDMVTLDGENFKAFTELMSSKLPPPMLRLAIEMHPGLSARRKKQLIDMLEQLSQPPAPPPPSPEEEAAKNMALERQAAEIDKTRSITLKNKAEAFKATAQGDEHATHADIAHAEAGLRMTQGYGTGPGFVYQPDASGYEPQTPGIA